MSTVKDRPAADDILKAAAVTPYFDPGELASRYGEDALPLLFDACVAVEDQASTKWAIRLSRRREILKQLIVSRTLNAFLPASTGRTETGLTGLLRHALLGDPWPNPALLKPEELDNYLRVAEWTEALPDVKQPDVELARQLRELEVRLKPFEALADRHFVGRDKELAMLLAVMGQAQNGPLESIANMFRKNQRLAVVHGPGGIGKTTLVGKALLAIHRNPETCVPIAFVDFERPDVDPEDPATAGYEMVRQLAATIGALRQPDRERLRDLSMDLSDSLYPISQRTERNGPDSRSGIYDDSQEQLASARARLLRVAEALGALQYSEQVLVVFDTVEKVQRLGNRFVDLFQAFVKILMEKLPGSHVVIISRSPIPSLGGQAISLQKLDTSTAASLFAHITNAPATTAEDIIAQVGTQPLTIHLAARLYLLEQPTPEDYHNMREGLVARIFKKQLAPGVLYHRILRHLKDDRLQILAERSLILRRISPEILKDVLAPACNLPEMSLGEAQQFVDQLATVTDLVHREPDGTLIHREDVRQECYRILTHTKADLVRDVHQRAAEFYARARKTSPATPLPLVAEEIYHRASAGEDFAAIQKIYAPGAERFLVDLRDDPNLPAASPLLKLLDEFKNAEQIMASPSAVASQVATAWQEKVLAKEAFDRIQTRDEKIFEELTNLLGKQTSASPDVTAAWILAGLSRRASAPELSDRKALAYWEGFSEPARPPRDSFLTIAAFITASRSTRKEGRFWTDMVDWVNDIEFWHLVYEDPRAMTVARNLMRQEDSELDDAIIKFVPDLVHRAPVDPGHSNSRAYQSLIVDLLVESGRFNSVQAFRSILRTFGPDRVIDLFGSNLLTTMDLLDPELGLSRTRREYPGEKMRLVRKWRESRRVAPKYRDSAIPWFLDAVREIEPQKADLFIWIVRLSWHGPKLVSLADEFLDLHRGFWMTETRRQNRSRYLLP